jgi:hypothetical protein
VESAAFLCYNVLMRCLHSTFFRIQPKEESVPGLSRLAAVAAAALIGLCACAAAAEFDQDVVPFSDKFPVEITVSGHDQVYDLAALGIDIDGVDGTVVRAYVNPTEVDLLESMGYEVKRIPNEALRMWRSLREEEGLGTKDVYHDYTALTSYLQGVAADHPGITRLISIGKTVQNRELWFMKISDYPDSQENEPEFKYISTMHGDEPVGVENCLKFIDWITDNYDSPDPDPWLKNIVDNVEIWVMPMMNPDGNTAGSRYNAHGVDLNRDFPDRFYDPDNTPVGREPETAAMMIFSDSMAFDLSANFHGGALVVNYPWDNRYQRAPDDSLYMSMSLAYSYHNPPMWNSPSFDYGITNGWDWYEAHGTMQDWNYDYGHNMEVTIELGNTKWPPVSQLPQYWADNDTSMVAYLERCLRGVRGVVTDSVTGEPMLATVTAYGVGWDDRSDPDVGDYHRLLDPGTYTLDFSAPGYRSKRFTGVVVTADSATVLDVELAPALRVAVEGTVTAAGGGPLLATVEARYHDGGDLGDSATTDPGDGSYSLEVAEGEYDITARAVGYAPEALLADVHRDTTFDFVLDPVVGNILVIDDYSALTALSKSPDRDVALGLPVLGTSASGIASDLETLGYAAVLETSASTDSKTWTSYDFIIWSSGDDTSPVSSSAYRRDLIDYTAAGGKLLIEGGELAYDAASSPGYPNFADSVLYVGDWDDDNAGSLVLDMAHSGHPIATDPNILPSMIGITYAWYGDLDAAVPAGGGYIIYGTTDYPADAGLLVHDDGARPQIVFYAFAYSAITDRTEARHLLENTVTYLYDAAAGAGESAGGAARVRLAAAPNPFTSAAGIRLALPVRGEINLAVYDVAGRLVRTLAAGDYEAGAHSFEWNGADADGRPAASGIYFVRLKGPGATLVTKLLKIR